MCWLICPALRSEMMPCSGQGVGEPVQLTDGPAHSLSRQFKGQHVYQLFMSVLTNSINHNININTSIISATFNEWSSHDTPLGTSEETESTKVMTQKTSPLDKIVRKLSGLSPTEAENIQELQCLSFREWSEFFLQSQDCFLAWAEYLGKWVLNVLFMFKKAILSHKYSCKRPS